MDRVEKNVRCSDDNIARVSWRTTSQASQFSFSGEQCDNFIDDRFPAVDAIIAFEGDRQSCFFLFDHLLPLRSALQQWPRCE